jgi:hypothetical protein
MLGSQSSFRVLMCAIPALLLAAGSPALYSQTIAQTATSGASVTQHAECSYFTEAQRQKTLQIVGARSRLTEQVTRMRMAQSDSSSGTRSTAGFTPNGGNSSGAADVANMGTIDRNIFQALAQAGVAPAPPTTDQEFYRRVTLDLTGRIPTVAALTAFLADTTPNKRAVYIDQLLASSQWVDKWTMFFGDMYLNTTTTSQGVNRGNQGRDAFYNFIKTNLTADTPYNKMATAIISHASADTTTATESNFTKGELDWLLGGIQTGSGIPAQDTYDQMAANVADTFLGIQYVNCLLCHNGAGHLTSISLWGGQQQRYQAWGFAAFMARTKWSTESAAINGETPWAVTSATTGAYNLNTTSGNRPARQPSATPNNASTIAPNYFFTNTTPPAGDYRTVMAQMVTGDVQFARATVNYIWANLFSLGIVDPPDTFDLDRLDPYNPPPSPWTLQPSNALLLNELTQDFINSGYDLKALMREIANSQTYQLSSRYNGTWNEAWEPLFARKLVRRLTAEEIHDAITQTSNVPSSFTLNSGQPYALGPFTYAMQYPDTNETGSGSEVTFLDDFLRGNRLNLFRSGDSSATQALDLMNSSFVMGRVTATGSGSTASLLQQNMSLSNSQMINNLFLTVLSRYPSTTEMGMATANVNNNHSTESVNLLWTLYNKVDFIFNY